MSKRDALEARLRAELTVPNHTFKAGANGLCFSCGQPLSTPFHLTEQDPDFRDSVAPTAIPTGIVEASVEPPDERGVMVALFPRLDVAEELALPGGEPADELHVTLAFLGKGDGIDIDKLLGVVQAYAEHTAPLSGEVSGLGLFTAGPNPVTYASVDVPGLPEFRQGLVQCLEVSGFPPSQKHGFTPHMTLDYNDRRSESVPNKQMQFDTLTVAIKGERHTYALTGTEKAWDGGQAVVEQVIENELVAAPVHPLVSVLVTDHTNVRVAQTEVNERAGVKKKHKYIHPASGKPVPKDVRGGYFGTAFFAFPPCAQCGEPFMAPQHDNEAATGTNDNGDNGGAGAGEKAFVTEAYGKTLITAPAAKGMGPWEKALTPNNNYLWLQGRFVGGEKANRNGALWSSSDLELGHPTVQYGPLNWLHESRHIIGTIADTQLVPTEAASNGEPYIAALSNVWKWIYPEEAWVIENASDSGKLWYSMECISKDVQCTGENGCGTQVSYGDYIKNKGGTCGHMRERSATRRFINPTFLGGAVIVPPVRPGWADADLRIVREQSALIEKSYEEANSNLSAAEWERLMAEVLGFAAMDA